MEKHEQIAVINWASYIPEIKNRLFHIPNGGSRHVAEAISLKKQGVKKGVSDLFLPIPKNGFHGLWIEIKAKKGRVSPEQQAWIDDMLALGYAAIVAYGADAAITGIKSYMEIV